MYQNHFRFESYPFQNTPNPAFFFASQILREALASMLYGVQEGKGFILITGDVGTGKTTLVQALKAELGDQHIVIEINNPWISHEEILDTIRRAVLVTEPAQTGTPPSNTQIINELKERLTELDQSERRVILVIDEAHQLPERTLEGIRLISNIETPARKLIQIILLGQDELGTMLSRYSLRQIEQRISLASHLTKLSREDTEAYIRHRLRVARGSDSLFSSESIDVIYPASQGIPRIINHLCDFCLLTAFHKNAQYVDVETAREVAASLPPMQTSASPAPVATPKAAPAKPAVAAPAPPPPREAPIHQPQIHQQPIHQATIHHPASHASPVQDFVSPREPAGRASPLPHFMPPQTEEWDNTEREPGGIRWRYVLPTLLIGLAIGAGAILFVQYGMHSEALPWVKSNQQAGMSGQRPPEAVTADNMRSRNAQELYLKGAAALSSAAEVQVPFPVDPGRLSRVEVVTVTPEIDISLSASKKFGAWNETVQDVILGANPDLSSLTNLPPNTAVKMPVLDRDSMIVQDGKGGAYIYYASFGNEAMAKDSLDTLKKIWAGAFLVTTQRKGVPVYRVYLGNFDSAGAAQNMVRSIWFKYLPNLN